MTPAEAMAYEREGMKLAERNMAVMAESAAYWNMGDDVAIAFFSGFFKRLCGELPGVDTEKYIVSAFEQVPLPPGRKLQLLSAILARL